MVSSPSSTDLEVLLSRDRADRSSFSPPLFTVQPGREEPELLSTPYVTVFDAEPTTRNSETAIDSSASQDGSLDLSTFRRHWLDSLPTDIQSNLVIAGGSIHGLAQKSDGAFLGRRDVDYFIVGSVTDDHVHYIVQKLATWLQAHRGMRSAIRTLNTVSFSTEGERDGLHDWHTDKAQVILRKYRDVAHLLYSFDIACAALSLAPHDNAIQATELALFAHRTRIMPVDCSRRSPTFERRLAKYFRRGVGMAFPGLDAWTLAEAFAKTPFCADPAAQQEYTQLPLDVQFKHFKLQLRKRQDERVYSGRFLLGRNDGYALVQDLFGYSETRRILSASTCRDMNDLLLMRAIREGAVEQPPLALAVPMSNIAQTIDLSAYCPTTVGFSTTFSLDLRRPLPSQTWTSSNEPLPVAAAEWYVDFYSPGSPTTESVPVRWPASSPPGLKHILFDDILNASRMDPRNTPYLEFSSSIGSPHAHGWPLAHACVANALRATHLDRNVMREIGERLLVWPELGMFPMDRESAQEWTFECIQSIIRRRLPFHVDTSVSSGAVRSMMEIYIHLQARGLMH
ncbi:MAG: hypothetical protein M1831_004239 [Alyxoria varia]|nr:MAG: hypothetical protein M1831_004239 [Alyxoria varia]